MYLKLFEYFNSLWKETSLTEFIGKNGTMKVILIGQMRNSILAMIKMQKVHLKIMSSIIDTIDSNHLIFQVHVQFH